MATHAWQECNIVLRDRYADGISVMVVTASMKTATMETFFSHAEAQFAPVIPSVEMDTAQFLSSCDKVVEFISFFGAAYAPVRMDVGGNVTKVRTKYTHNVDECRTLDDLLAHDYRAHADKSGLPHAAEGFLWLKRGLQFMCEFLLLLVEEHDAQQNNVANVAEEKEISVGRCIRASYNKTLLLHHGWVSKQLFKVLMHAAPTRSTLLNAVLLHQPVSDAEAAERRAIEDARAYLTNFHASVQAAHRLCLKYKLEEGDTS